MAVMKSTGAPFRAVSFTRRPVSALATAVPDGARWHPSLDGVMAALPGGPQRFWGIPFEFRPARGARRWIWLTLTRPSVKIPVPRAFAASHIIVAHFSVPDMGTRSSAIGAPSGRPLDPGRHLADYVIRSAAGAETVFPIRRRFEITDVLVGWGQLPFAARPHREVRVLDAAGPHGPGRWAPSQVGAEMPMYAGVDVDTLQPTDVGSYWLTSLPLAGPDPLIQELELTLRSEGPIAVAAITLYSGTSDPLQRSPTRTISVGGRGRPSVGVDLGIIARDIGGETIDRDWLADPARGLGAEMKRPTDADRRVQLER